MKHVIYDPPKCKRGFTEGTNRFGARVGLPRKLTSGVESSKKRWPGLMSKGGIPDVERTRHGYFLFLGV